MERPALFWLESPRRLIVMHQTTEVTTNGPYLDVPSRNLAIRSDEVFPGTRHQRCWVHKTANVSRLS